MTADALTSRERDALDFIVGYIDECGWAPTIREISVALGISKAPAHSLLAGLEAKGRIARLHGVHSTTASRALRVLQIAA